MDSDSEHEEEFYYTEIEVNVDTVTQGLSDMSTSSPSSPPHRPAILDHDYQKKVTSLRFTIYYTFIDINEIDIRIYLPEKIIFTEAARLDFFIPIC